MNCEKAQRLVFLLESGEVTGRRGRDVEKHLALCSACSAFYREARSVLSAAERSVLPLDGPSPFVLTRIRAHAAEAVARPLFIFARPVVQWAAAAALMILLAGWWSWMPAGRSESEVNRISDLHAIMTIVSDGDDVAIERPTRSKDEMMRNLAEKLLRMEGLAEEDLSGEEFLEPQTTDPQSHSTPGLPSKVRV